jgi:cytochrome c553
LAFLLIAAVTIAGSAFAFGGWAVITVRDVPDHLTVGQPTTIAFSVRQHGQTPLGGLVPSIEARQASAGAGAFVRGAVRAGAKDGEYVGTLAVPKAGEWRVTIRSGFGRSDLALLPLQATDGRGAVAALTAAERGRHLFVAKGCVMCHERAGLETKPMAAVAPDLTGRTFDPAYLALWLANPRIRPPTKGYGEMPNLGLSQQEIAALSAFINDGTRVAARQQ